MRSNLARKYNGEKSYRFKKYASRYIIVAATRTIAKHQIKTSTSIAAFKTENIFGHY